MTADKLRRLIDEADRFRLHRDDPNFSDEALANAIAEANASRISRFRPCSKCGGSPDIHNTNRGAEFVGHEYA